MNSVSNTFHRCNISNLLLILKLINFLIEYYSFQFALSDKNELFTWGTSPQALRLANQVKKRANAKSKIEESFKREINRRNEAANSENAPTTSQSAPRSPPKEITIPVPVLPPKDETPPEIPKSSSDGNIIAEVAAMNDTDSTERRRHSDPIPKDEGKSNTTWYLGELPSSSSSRGLATENAAAEGKTSDQEVDDPEPSIEEEDIVKIENIDAPPVPGPSAPSKEEKLASVRSSFLDEEVGDHMVPHKVDTSEVSGEILQVSAFFVIIRIAI